MTPDSLDTAEVERRLGAAFAARDAALDIPAPARTAPPPARRTSPRVLVAAAAIVVLVAAATYLLVATHRSHHNGSLPAAPTSPAPVTTSPSRGIDPYVEGRLWNLAHTFATSQGATIASVQAVRSTAARVFRLVAGGSSSTAKKQPMWAVQVRAAHPFTCTCGLTRKLRYLALQVEPGSYTTVGSATYFSSKKLASIGTVFTLHDTGVADPTPTLGPAQTRAEFWNPTHRPLRLFGCPRCNGSAGLLVEPRGSLDWMQSEQDARYWIVIDGRRADCARPPAPAPGGGAAIAYHVTPQGKCYP